MPPIIYVSPFENLWVNISQLIWPSLAVGVRYISITLRMTRSAMLDILAENYIQTARSKGVPEPTVAKTHALRNAFLPILTLLGAEFAFLMGGLVVTEQVFNLNGLGALLIQAVETADYAIIQGVVMLIAFIFVFINFIIDIIYTLLDPRIRYN